MSLPVGQNYSEFCRIIDAMWVSLFFYSEFCRIIDAMWVSLFLLFLLFAVFVTTENVFVAESKVVV